MAGFQAPAGFSLIGTADRDDGMSQTVAYRTSRAGDVAYGALFASLQAEGWEVEDMQIGPRVFNLATGPVSGTLCLNGERRSLGVTDLNDTRYVTISISTRESTRACNAQDRARSMIMARMSMLSADAPTLTFPVTTTSAAASGALPSGGGGSGETYQIDVQVISPDPASSLLGHLGAQMGEQGWQVDANWSGRLSNGGRWTRVTDDGTPMWVTLEIVALGDEMYDVSYRQMLPPF
jgi:hypothetical protein